jgi:hypothetical protein
MWIGGSSIHTPLYMYEYEFATTGISHAPLTPSNIR